MTLGPQEIVRSEVEGSFSGPANSLTPESIDCGCSRYQLPRLAKFATRQSFLALLCCIGVLQAAAQAYLHVTSSTIARRFQFDPYLMEWILCTSEIVLVIVALTVAYWGDRIHRASWLGGTTLIQCATFLTLLIPHGSNWLKITTSTDEPVNVTHMSIYAEESPDLCMRMSSRLIALEDPPHYSTLFILIAVQIVTGMANVAYYALGISYLDDNTKKIHVAVYFGVVLATKVLGSILGYILGWSFLRIDAEDLSSIRSYRDQIGAWWLGWPILSVMLAIPAGFMAIFPRKLPSELVEEAAATIIDQSGTLRGSQRNAVKKVGSPDFFPSILRLLTNKILICNVLAAAFFLTALINFMANENIFLESRFYAPRPTGMLLGFGDPLLSRTVTTIIKPLLAGLVIIISGLVIARAKPNARMLVIYSLITLISSALIIFGLAFDNCDKPPIVGAHRGSIVLNRFCNRECGCSRDADFRPVCDSRGTLTFYSPCHAGCTAMDYDGTNKVFSNCSCVEDDTGQGNTEAREGPCGSDSCQVGWLIYEILTIVVYAASASTIVGDLLISLRSVNVQDKALTIGYSMTLLAFFTYAIGKISYDELAKSTCQHWGLEDRICHLHHSTDLGNYLCFLTAGLIVVAALFKVGVWLFCQDLEMYDPTELEESQPREMKDMSKTQAEPLLQPQATSEQEESNQRTDTVDDVVEPVVVIESNKLGKENGPVANVDEGEPSRLRYGPLGPGNRRVLKTQFNASIPHIDTDDDLDSSEGSQTLRKGSASQVSYKPLELDSDVESEMSGTLPRSKKLIPNAYDPGTLQVGIRAPFSNKPFPNPENYEDPRKVRSSRDSSPNVAADGSSKTNSFEYSKKRKDSKPLSASRGDFNEVGIPVVEPLETAAKGSMSSLRSPTIMMAITQLDRNPSREILEQTRFTYAPSRKHNTEEMEENRKFRLEKLMQPMNYLEPTARPPSRDQASSGFGSLQDMRERARLPSEISDSRDSLSSKSSTSGPPKKGGPLCTDL
ncbi:solute carrier organic anion transporter family member 2B1 isoform X2 [Nasonia vitripennis]|uniref:Kazal-like domain-containing protein n=1 Tax=Nasonia vitripennis TaxID=7425 RepID=A0A7M7M1U2_NASVI|nr:solute carrier organic anion transporter family member 2B1 isoform X2 [Nasonia vitripennis]